MTKSTNQVGSVRSSHDLKTAAQIIAQGEVVGVFNRGVNALWLNSESKQALEKLKQIKDELKRGNRPVALTISFEKLAKMINASLLAKEAREFLEISTDLKKDLGSLCFLRVPVKKEYINILPQSSIGFDETGQAWVQSWDPHGHKPAEKLIYFIHSLGVKFPSVTSMNVSGEMEIVDQLTAEQFCQYKGIKFYLRDHQAHPDIVGSYTIITFSSKGIELTREGNIPGKIFEPIFGFPLIKENAKPSKYPQMEFPDQLISGLSRPMIRTAILLYLEGHDPAEINKKLKKESSK